MHDDPDQNIQSAQQAVRLAQNTHDLLQKTAISGHPEEMAYAQQRLQDALGQVLQTQDFVSQCLNNEQMQELNQAAFMLQALYHQLTNLDHNDYV